jgi:predicted nucleotidyltransferase
VNILPHVRSEIEQRLQRVEREQNVRIIMAVESGSRAWGFPSPDSDYDIRFLYVKTFEWYLQLEKGRDVIDTVEYPIIDLIDLNGWDIRKALKLLLKSNAIISEWMESPIRYRQDDPIISELKQLADTVLDTNSLVYHYRNLAEDAADRWLGGSDDDVSVKKYFYALRPALALRTLRLHPGSRPPMNLQQLVDLCDLDQEVIGDITRLVEAKGITNERANSMRVSSIDRLVRTELDQYQKSLVIADSQRTPDNLKKANDLFIKLLSARPVT